MKHVSGSTVRFVDGGGSEQYEGSVIRSRGVGFLRWYLIAFRRDTLRTKPGPQSLDAMSLHRGENAQDFAAWVHRGNVWTQPAEQAAR